MVIANPWEPDGSWITVDSKAVPLSKNTNQSEDDTSYNKAREFSKIINFIRDIKSLVKKTQRKTAKRRKGEDKISGGKTTMPIRPSSTYRNIEDVIIKVNRKNRPDHQEILNKLRKLLKERRKKITQIKAGEEKSEKHDPNKG